MLSFNEELVSHQFFNPSSVDVVVDADSMLYLSLPNKEELKGLELLNTSDLNSEALELCKSKFDALYNYIRNSCNSSKLPSLIFSCDRLSNYRFALYPAYKASRQRPNANWLLTRLKGQLQAFVYTTYPNIAHCLNCEADDFVAYLKGLNPSAIVCSIDKDVLNQLPGTHFNYAKSRVVTTSTDEARKFLLLQILMGDPVDNIPGLPGVGSKRAKSILQKFGYSIEAVKEIYNLHNNPNFKRNAELVDIQCIESILNLTEQNAVVVTKLKSKYI